MTFVTVRRPGKRKKTWTVNKKKKQEEERRECTQVLLLEKRKPKNIEKRDGWLESVPGRPPFLPPAGTEGWGDVREGQEA